MYCKYTQVEWPVSSSEVAVSALPGSLFKNILGYFRTVAVICVL
uniref:Uncharacterized protein n=1 Tax=Anguilla anguilla TaxID=7936 RepID=A0A0E9RVN0_ANGAN